MQAHLSLPFQFFRDWNTYSRDSQEVKHLNPKSDPALG